MNELFHKSSFLWIFELCMTTFYYGLQQTQGATGIYPRGDGPTDPQVVVGVIVPQAEERHAGRHDSRSHQNL